MIMTQKKDLKVSVPIIVIGIVFFIGGFISCSEQDKSVSERFKIQKERSIPISNHARTYNDLNREMYLWTVGDADEKIFSSMPATLRTDLFEYTEDVCKIVFFPSEEQEKDRVIREGTEMMDRGVNNSLLKKLYGLCLYEQKKYSQAQPFLEESIMRQPIELSGIDFLALRCLADVMLRDIERDPGVADFLMIEALNVLSSIINNGSFSTEEEEVAYELINQTPTIFYSVDNYAYVYDQIRSNRQKNKWLVLMLEGQLELEQAWEARGTGWARSVSDENWALMKEHLSNATQCFTEALELRPDRPQPSSEMIQVSMMSSGISDLSPREWFYTAVEAQMDYSNAYFSYSSSLRPRWGGSYQEMIDFGEECLNTKRFDTDVPMIYLDMLRTIGSESANYSYKKPFREKSIVANLRALFEGLLFEEERRPDYDRLRFLQAVSLTWCGEYQKANEIFQHVNPEIDVKDGFWGNCLSWSCRKYGDIKAEFQSLESSWKYDFENAERCILNNDPEKAITIYKDILRDSNDDLRVKGYARDQLAMLWFGETAGNMSFTPLLTAAIIGDEDISRFLVENGTNVNDIREFQHWTPLYYALKHQNPIIAKLFIENGADVNAKTIRLFTPLHQSIVHGYNEITALLIDRGANLNAISEDGWSILHYALYYKQPELAKKIILNNADINIFNNSGWTPLHIASYLGFKDVVELLIQKGAALQAKTMDGDTAFSIARNNRHTEIAKLLEGDRVLEENQ